ncbi:hypothetical protein [Streptomyces sp. AF1A]|uniref:hypothetical protein n=1 Tax=Streptomyces sp. AF1A TaxID=3394350 RepID=UPI0039BCC2EA
MNHGPDDKGTEGLDPGLDGLGAQEQALRRLLRSAVDDIEPRTGTLDHLRRAVPARRARKRQAAVGMVAAALFLGTAVPALVHVSDSGGSDPNTAMAGQSSQAQGGTGAGKGKGGDAGARTGAGSSAKPGKEPGKAGGNGRNGSGGIATGGTDPSATSPAGPPLCTATQLGSATGSADAPDSAGVVYGTFRVTNVSATACTVGGTGTVGATAQGAADPAKVVATRHASGDAATALPDPSVEVSGLVLQPGSAYEEKFAFVPSETCPTSGGASGGSESGGSTPDPTPSQGASASAGAADNGGSAGAAAPQLLTEDGTADGSVVVSHTAQPGSPTVTAVVPGQCAGTVYYTGVLAGA